MKLCQNVIQCSLCDIYYIVLNLQTAERIRESYPERPWFALVGLLHDLGKVLAMKGEPQWAVVGDVFVTGCKPSPSVVFGEPRLVT